MSDSTMNPSERSAAFSKRIEGELASGEFVFPTSMQAAVKVRRALDEPDASLVSVSRVVGLEPLLSVKLLRMANSVFFNPQGNQVTDVYRALMRVGLNNTRTLAYAIIGDQLSSTEEFAPVWQLAEQLWQHTVDVAALSYAIALQLDDIAPDTALLTGMVSDIGQFYLLSRVHEFPEILLEQGEIGDLILSQHRRVGQSVLNALGTPPLIVDAVSEADVGQRPWPPQSLGDILYLAGTAAEAQNPFSITPLAEQIVARHDVFASVDETIVNRLLDEARIQKAAAMAMLA